MLGYLRDIGEALRANAIFYGLLVIPMLCVTYYAGDPNHRIAWPAIAASNVLSFVSGGVMASYFSPRFGGEVDPGMPGILRYSVVCGLNTIYWLGAIVLFYYLGSWLVWAVSLALGDQYLLPLHEMLLAVSLVVALLICARWASASSLALLSAEGHPLSRSWRLTSGRWLLRSSLTCASLISLNIALEVLAFRFIPDHPWLFRAAALCADEMLSTFLFVRIYIEFARNLLRIEPVPVEN